ncbi:hypothetical protein ABIE78_001653 [Sinorhizobium fredii]|uniref:Uncharacterized protein n=1 Tax=Sinorhizobium fredii (strain USDA 257) TaxID=1185652 RepID=I3X9B0_SINF2|nr:hypothetical protein [Sinorhizobium fredii]AFL52466.1 hypothetical protein USDA257_c39220 [Sinorhizobium fredii USDA 257]
MKNTLLAVMDLPPMAQTNYKDRQALEDGQWLPKTVDATLGIAPPRARLVQRRFVSASRLTPEA